MVPFQVFPCVFSGFSLCLVVVLWIWSPGKSFAFSLDVWVYYSGLFNRKSQKLTRGSKSTAGNYSRQSISHAPAGIEVVEQTTNHKASTKRDLCNPSETTKKNQKKKQTGYPKQIL